MSVCVACAGALMAFVVSPVLHAAEPDPAGDTPPEPPNPPVQLPPAPPAPPPVNGIDGRVAQRWSLREILPKIDNTGAQYQVATSQKYSGTQTIELKRAPSDEPVPKDLPALKEKVVQVRSTFELSMIPAIQTREMIAEAKRVRYSMGVYFADLRSLEETVQIATVTPVNPNAPTRPDGSPLNPVPPPVILPDEVRVLRRKDDGILVQQGENILVDSESGIAVEEAPAYLERSRGVSVLEVPAWPDTVALPGERVVEPIEQPPAALGALGQVFALKLPVDAKTGQIELASAAGWRVALDMTSLCGLPLKHAHAVAAHFAVVPQQQEQTTGRIVLKGSYIFALQTDEFRGDNDLLAALVRLEKNADLRDWKVQGAVGRGSIELEYSTVDHRVVKATWKETLTQLNLQVGTYDRKAYTGSREVSVQIKP